MDEKLKVNEEYLKAYNDADMIINHMPHELDNMEIPEHETAEYTQGFKDRVTQYEIEKDAMKEFTLEDLQEKYGPDLDDYGKDPREIDRDR